MSERKVVIICGEYVSESEEEWLYFIVEKLNAKTLHVDQHEVPDILMEETNTHQSFANFANGNDVVAIFILSDGEMSQILASRASGTKACLVSRVHLSQVMAYRFGVYLPRGTRMPSPESICAFINGGWPTISNCWEDWIATYYEMV